MLRRLMFLLCLFLLGSFGLATHAIAKPLAIADKDDVKDVIARFKSEMSALIAQAGGEARVTMLQGYQLSEALIGSLSAAYSGAAKLTFAELDKQQQKAFEDAARSLAKFEEVVGGRADELNQNLKDLNTTINTVAAWSSKPTVTRIWPSFVAPSHADGMVRVSVTGYKLHIGDHKARPTLTFSGKEFIADEYSNNSVGFLISRDAIPQPELKSEFLKAIMRLPQHPSCWLWVWCSDDEAFEFGLTFTVLPMKLGSMKLMTVQRGLVPKRKPFASRELHAEQNGGSDIKKDCFTPEAGWMFDTNSAKEDVVEKSGWYNGNQDNRYNKGDVIIDGIKTKENICIKVTSIIGAKEEHARTRGRLLVDMVKEELGPEEESNSHDQALDWLKDIRIPLRKEVVSQTIEVTLFDEISRQVSVTDGGKLPFLNIEPDIRNGAVFIRPLRDWRAH